MSEVRFNAPPLYSPKMEKFHKRMNTTATVANAAILTGAAVGADKFIKHGKANPESKIAGKVVKYLSQFKNFLKTKAYEPAKEYIGKTLKLAEKGSKSRNILASLKKNGKKPIKFVKNMIKGLNPKIRTGLYIALGLVGISHFKNKGKIEGLHKGRQIGQMEGGQEVLNIAAQQMQQLQNGNQAFVNDLTQIHEMENQANTGTMQSFLASTKKA